MTLQMRWLILAMLLVGLGGCTGEEPVDLSNLLTLPNGGESYLPEVLSDGRVMRWTKSTIAVWLDTTDVPPGWRSDYESYAVDALLQWQDASEGAFTFVRAEGPADINISWVYSIPGPGWIGGNTNWTSSWFTFTPMRITIAIGELTDMQIYASTLHEIGHALGMDGHSPNPEDAMHATSYTLWLSPNDIATLLDMYRRPAQIVPE